jgi:hypothetical protein
MNAQDQLKVIKAGFTILRVDWEKLQIKYKNKDHLEWSYLEDKYPSKASLKRDLAFLLLSSKSVED